MGLDFAPMEGVTSRDFREVHAACFPGVDRYWIPFLSPTASHQLTARQRRELEPGPLGFDRLVPQILTKDAADFRWAAEAIGALGYREVNLNLGCPSGTVVSKGKGAGLLRDPAALDRFLEAIFTNAPLPISVKKKNILIINTFFLWRLSCPSYTDRYNQRLLSKMPHTGILNSLIRN